MKDKEVLLGAQGSVKGSVYLIGEKSQKGNAVSAKQGKTTTGNDDWQTGMTGKWASFTLSGTIQNY